MIKSRILRVAQFLSIGLSIYFSSLLVLSYIREGYAGGIYGTVLVPLGLVSPCYFGLFVLFPFFNLQALDSDRILKLERNAKAYLWALGLQLALIALAFWWLKGTADEVVSFAILLVFTSFIFYILYFLMRTVLKSQSARKQSFKS